MEPPGNSKQVGIAIFAAFTPEKVRHNLQHLARAVGCREECCSAGRALLVRMLGAGVTGVRPQDGALVFHPVMQGAFLI